MSQYMESELDKRVIPLVRFFNENGLPTNMSCQGHNKTNMSMFWIEFDKTVTQDDIVKFMRNHLNWEFLFLREIRQTDYCIYQRYRPIGSCEGVLVLLRRNG